MKTGEGERMRTVGQGGRRVKEEGSSPSYAQNRGNACDGPGLDWIVESIKASALTSFTRGVSTR